MKTLVQLINESKGKVIFRGEPIIIISDNDKELKFTYKDKKYSISKKPIIKDCPYNSTWDGFPNYVSVNWYDGHCELFDNCDKHGKPSKYEEWCFYPNEKFSYPTITEIFSNSSLLEDALAYRIEHEDYGWYDNDIFSKLTLMDVIEGFFVCTGHYKKIN